MDCLLLNPISAFIAHPKHMVMTGKLREMQGGCGGAEERERGRREGSREVKWWECEVKRGTM